MATRSGTVGGADRPRTPAQLFATVGGAMLVLVGILGFIADSAFDTGNGVDGENFIAFEVNGWHNVVHLLSGLFLLGMARKRATARIAVLAFGAIYALVTIIGLMDGEDILGILPVNAADNVLHIVLTLGALAAGFASRADDGRGGRAPAGQPPAGGYPTV